MATTVDRLVAEIEANPAGAIAALRAFDTVMEASARDRDAEIDLDVAAAVSELAIFSGVMDAATRDRTIHVDVDNDLSGLATTLGGFQGALDGVQDALSGVGRAATGAAGGGGGSGGISAFGEAASGGAMAAARFGGTMQGLAQAFAPMIPMALALVAAMTLLPGLFASIAAGAGVLVGALAPLVALLGLIVPALGAFALVGGTLVAGLVGVVSGVSAYKEASEGASAATLELANRQDALRSAQQGLANSIHQVTQAQQALNEAQAQMKDAPLEAAEAIEDARIASAQAALNERKAIIALKQAQDQLTAAQEKTADVSYELTKQTDEFTGKVYDVAYASTEAVDGAMNERDARLAVKQAELDLWKARDGSGDAQRKLTEMERKGIKNSDIMVAARKRLADAEYNLAQAHQSVANSQRQVAQAQQSLNDGIKNGTAATNQWTEAMKKLSPEGITFVKFIADEFLPALGDIGKGVQTAMLPGIQKGLEAFLGMTDEVENELSIIGKMIGDTFAEFFEFWGRPRQQRLLTDMFESLNDVIRSGLKLIRPFSRILVSITDAAAPVFEDMLDSLTKKLNKFANWMESDKGKKKTTNFFEKGAKFGGLWLDVLEPLIGIFGGITKAAEPLATKMLTNLADDLDRISSWANSEEGQKTLRDYFKEGMEILGQFKGLIGDVIDILFSTNNGEDSAFYKFLVAMREDFIPLFRRFWKWMDEEDIMADLVEGFSAMLEIVESDGFQTFLTIIGDIFKFISWINEKWEWLEKHAGPITAALEMILNPSKAIKSAYDKINDNLEHFKDLWGKIKNAWSDFGEWVYENIIDPLDDVLDKLGKVGDALSSVLEKIGLLPDDTWGSGGTLSPSELEDLYEEKYGGKRQFGGPMEKGKPYIVGEKRPEVFVPSTSGRIMPTVTPAAGAGMSSTAVGVSHDQLESILERVLERAKPDVQMENHFEEKADPKHIARELAWSLT